MASVEPRRIDLDRWPGLVAPEGMGGIRAAAVALSLRSSVRALDLRIDFPDGSAAGEYDAPGRIVLLDPDLFWARLAAHGVAGLAESFMAGEWMTPGLPAVLTTLVPWVGSHPDCRRPGRRARGGMWRGSRHRATPLPLEDDLPGHLVALYTDETMSTTAGVFASGARTRTVLPDGTEFVRLESPGSVPHRTDLGDAQRRAADMLLDLAAVTDASRVLVAPAGWGEIPMRAADRGAWVRTVTSSTERLSLLGARIAAAELGASISVSLDPVSEVSGQVDAVLAVEPAGRDAVSELLGSVHTLLRPGGRLVLQCVLSRDEAGLSDLESWRRRYVSEQSTSGAFPERAESLSELPGLTYRGRVDLRAHHAETVRLWRENFAVRSRDAAALGFDAVFRRMWVFHLAALEASLREGWVETVQAVFQAPRTHGGSGTGGASRW